MNLKQKQLAFLGLGAMGFPIAYGLYKTGFSLMIPTYRSPVARGFSPIAPDAETKQQLLKEMFANGVKGADSLKELVSSCDVLLLSLPTSRQVEEVMYAPDGILANIRPGSIIIDLTSADPASTRKLSALLADRNVQLLDAPISGGPMGASNQTLSVMVGGKEETFEAYREIFDTIGDPSKVYYMGPSGAGDTVKCANNFLSSCCFAATAEALAVCARAGISPQAAAKLIDSSGGRSHATSFKFPELIFAGKNMGMSTNLMLKDIRLFLETGRQYDIPTFIGDIIYQLWNLQAAEGNGDKDFKCVIEMYERWCDVKLNGIDA